MMILENMRTAIHALRANKVRSVLTTLGITVGVAAVICVMAVGAGAREQVTEQIRRLGTNLLLIQPEQLASARARPASTQRAFAADAADDHGSIIDEIYAGDDDATGDGNAAAQKSAADNSEIAPAAWHTLTTDDAAAILQEIPGVQIAAQVVWGKKQVVAGANNWSTTIFGNDSDYLAARDWQLAAGRTFIDDEIRSGAKVAIVGQVVAERLHLQPGSEEAGIRVGNVPFNVVGVLERKGQNPSGRSEDDLVLVPAGVARRSVLGGEHARNRHAIDYLLVKFRELSSPDDAKQLIEMLLRSRHKLENHAPNDFNIFNSEDVFATQDSSARAFSLLLISIASISLIVGGISIMNTMLMSVTDRTREIGLRMAVGARRRDICGQFLVEAVALALIGGIFGTVLGAATAAGIAEYGGWPVLISPAAVLLACGVASLVGLMFGSLPAYRASKLDPMTALRFE